ncbi:MAG: hypothetical protein EHM23_15020 [Acidobacteria bacterium]|nr:MAG: hypothetical protein EHM23_15020 [Acidobacteriota bacterium]
MPRSNRYILPGYIYHVTHRCHDRRFLLKFGVDQSIGPSIGSACGWPYRNTGFRSYGEDSGSDLRIYRSCI